MRKTGGDTHQEQKTHKTVHSLMEGMRRGKPERAGGVVGMREVYCLMYEKKID